MDPYLTVVAVALVTLLQTTIMPYATLGEAQPMLPLLAVASWTLERGAVPGGWWALLAGAALDVLSPQPLGYHTLPLLAVVLVAAAGRGRFFPTNLILPGVVVAAATVVALLVSMALVATRGGMLGAEIVGQIVLPSVALNLLWLPVVYFPLRFLAGRTRGPRIEWEH